MYQSPHDGRHELGYNVLLDRSVIDAIGALVAQTHGPLIEFGSGDGALTLPLSRSGRAITAVELNPRNARRLRQRTECNVTVVTTDILRFRLPPQPHVVVGNLPFHLTTAIMRQLLAATSWRAAVLVVQWEVARRRAGIGGASMLTASWWPWYEFSVHSRVPAQSFRPVPSVDAAILTIARRSRPLVNDRAGYQRLVKAVLTGRGRGLGQILEWTGRFSRPALQHWMQANRLDSNALPKQLTADQWPACGSSPGPVVTADTASRPVQGCARPKT